MRFRPCIDIHNGQVKQIVGGSLCDEGDRADENFVSQKLIALTKQSGDSDDGGDGGVGIPPASVTDTTAK